MKNSKSRKIVLLLSLLLIIPACGKVANGDGSSGNKSGENIIVVDDKGKEANIPRVSLEKIDRYENMEITDWLNENTVIVSKENSTLEKLNLAELSDSYPKSLYLYNINTKGSQLLKEQKSGNLGGAILSSDKKNLLYYEFTLGDPAFYVMNMDTLETFSLNGVMSAKWADNETIIGASYSGGVYLADTKGKITILNELNEESLIIAEKIKDNIFFNTGLDESLWRLNLSAKKKIKLPINDVDDIVPSPDDNQILVIQRDGPKKNLTIYDTDGNKIKQIAEGIEIEGVSWSQDQRMIAFNLKSDLNGKITSGLHIYDMLSDKSTQVAVDVQNIHTRWNTTNEEFISVEYNGKQYNSTIVYLEFSLGK